MSSRRKDDEKIVCVYIKVRIKGFISLLLGIKNASKLRDKSQISTSKNIFELIKDLCGFDTPIYIYREYQIHRYIDRL